MLRVTCVLTVPGSVGGVKVNQIVNWGGGAVVLSGGALESLGSLLESQHP